ncbi:MAG: N-acetyltransferase family protein [Methylophilus sp.]|uniref:GNAT family N-acetyltransferase n=1 Tax=Methylophilus sp. TaxID=29541 RepID=UPI003F9FFEED
MRYLISPISEEYLEGFAAAVSSVVREQQYLSFNEPPTAEMTRDFVLRNINGHWPHYVLLEKQTVIGWCDITPLQRSIYAHVGVLGIGIIETHRNQGLGKRLIQTALDAAKNKGLSRIQLTVREHNYRAIRLYERFGFVKEGLHMNAEKRNGQFENLISMALLYTENNGFDIKEHLNDE